MAWAKPQYSKRRIDWAGDFVAGPFILPRPLSWFEQHQEAIDIVNNWRAVHSYPLHAIKMMLKNRAQTIYPEVVVAQRLKRLASIQVKLRLSKARGNHPKLSQMQDIGGCRAIVEDVKQVRKLEEVFAEARRKNPRRGHEYSTTDDYITMPKSDGYRSVHLVYRFRSGSPEHSCYNGQRIEIQLRSRFQHAWATAVETYSTVSGEALKSNVGSVEWKRFFALASSVIARLEQQPAVPGTPTESEELLCDLRELYTRLNVQKLLGGVAALVFFYQAKAAGHLPATPQGAMTQAEWDAMQSAHLYLLVLDPDTRTTRILPYAKEDTAEATATYAEYEKDKSLQAVLVSVDGLEALRTAYPNYFLDTQVFLTLIEDALNARRIIV